MSTRNRAALRQSKPHRRHQRLYAAIAVVVAIAAVVAIFANRNASTSASSLPQTQPVTVSGSALAPFTSATNDPAVGQTIPTVSGSNFAGTPESIAADGKPKVLLFVAHWCPHCRREVPLLAPDLRAHPLPAGVEMITISTNVTPSAPNYPPSAWLAGVNWPTPVIADDANSSAAAAYGLTAFPYFVFVDAQNKVVSRASGEITLAQFRADVATIAT